MTSGLALELTSFVGRGAELEAVTGLLRRRRLVTLAGVGGCGKSRLAARAAAALGNKFSDGVGLVELGLISQPDALPAAIAASVGRAGEPGSEQTSRLTHQLRGSELLLLLDTCEHVLEAVAELVEDILANCPGVTVLATSREPLGVAGEAVWRVPSLRADEAAELFTDRALLAAPSVDLGDARDQVAAICSRLDRLPLAIELAASWVRALTPSQIEEGLEDAFRLLVGGPRRAVARHQTLEASMAWSHALLSDAERRHFRRLSVFVGAFSLEAAAALGEDETLGDTAAIDQLSLVTKLLDRSLLTAQEVGGELRYRMLDTVRQYAAVQLHAAGEGETVRDRHLHHFLVWVERAEAGHSTDVEHWRLEIERCRPDITAALAWGLDSSADRAASGRRLAAAMSYHWMMHGHAAEGLPMLRRALALHPDDETRVQARLHAGLAMMGMVSGRLDLTTESAAEGARLAELAGDPATAARCLALSAFPEFFVDFEQCERSAISAERAAAEAADWFARDWASVLRAYALITRTRHSESVAAARPALVRSRERRDPFCASFALGVEMFPLMQRGDLAGAVAIGREVVDQARPLGNYFAGTLVANGALALILHGDYEEAASLCHPVAEGLARESEVDPVGFMVTYGLLQLCQGEYEGALTWLQLGIDRLTRHERDWTAARCIPGYVSALRGLKRHEEAAAWCRRGLRLLAAFEGWFEYADLLDEQGRLAGDDSPDASRELHLQALVVRRDHDLRLGFADSMDALARVTMTAGCAAEATRLLAASTAMREAMGYPRWPVELPAHETLVAAARAALGEQDFFRAWAHGSGSDPDQLVASLTRGRGPRTQDPGPLGGLTRTELDIARLVARGMSNPEIAHRLYMSRSTVKAHLSHSYSKLGIANRTELAAMLRTHER